MAKFVDRTGFLYGRLTVIAKTDGRVKSGSVIWLCRCSCGKETIASGSVLQSGQKISCGCYFLEVAAAKGRAKKIHGMTNTKAYRSWSGMKQRCYNKKNQKFPEYGGRGISVCERWSSFENFISDMGAPKEHESIDRVDVNGNYCPENCRWATQLEQQNNRRDNVIFEVNGERLTMAQYARKYGLNEDKIQQRLARGWSFNRAVAP